MKVCDGGGVVNDAQQWNSESLDQNAPPRSKDAGACEMRQEFGDELITPKGLN